MLRIRHILVLLYTALLVACVSGPQTSEQINISIIGMNDVHGALAADGEVGGLVNLSAYVDALRKARMKDGGAVLLIDAGDMWQGTLDSNLTEGATVVEAYNAMGVTAAAIGNHEFDFGPEGTRATPLEDGDDPRGALKQRIREAKFPVLAANLIDDSTGKPVDWEGVRPSVIVDAAGIKVGVIGVMTTRALVTTIAANIQGLSIDPLAAAITREARQLRRDGADLVVVTAHAGGRCEDFSDPSDVSSCVMSAEIMRVANDLEPGLVDHIIAGHTHNPMAHVFNGISITSNSSRTHSFGRVDFRIDNESRDVIDRKVFPPHRNTAALDGEYEGYSLIIDPAVVRIAASAEAGARELKERKLGVRLAGPFELVPDIESAMSNLMTEAILESFDADIAIHNVFGGIRAGLPAGDLTYGSVYEMFPFDNIVTIHEITGADLRRIIANKTNTHRKAGFAGMRVVVSCDDEGMQVEMRLEDGREIEDDDSIRIIANDFLALGGDGVLTPVIPDGGFELRQDMPLTRDALVAWFSRQGESLDPADFETHAAPKWTVPDTFPSSCQVR